MPGGLDLAETSTSLIQMIKESIIAALEDEENFEDKMKNANINLVTQSYEFEDTRYKFSNFAKRYFKNVLLLSDWQITYFSTFSNTQGISLIVDKVISLSYTKNNALKKLGGWKFTVYDLGGENWLGTETIRHTIEAVEGFMPMTKLVQNILTKFNGKIERITETCFKGTKDHDVFSLFCEPLLRACLTNDPTAKEIIGRGFQAIENLIKRVDGITGKELKIALNGSLTDIYKPLFNESRLLTVISDIDKAAFLADVNIELLESHGVATKPSHF